MPTIIEPDHEGRHLRGVTPRFSYDPLIIPAGRAAHIGGGWWLKRCAAPWCNTAWARRWGFYLTERAHAEHEAAHGLQVPGFNAPLLGGRP